MEHFSQMLFVERLRTPQDRQHLMELYCKCWGHPLPLTQHPELVITPDILRLGWAVLPRSQGTLQSPLLPLTSNGGHTPCNSKLAC